MIGTQCCESAYVPVPGGDTPDAAAGKLWCCIASVGRNSASAFRLDLWPVRTPLTVVSAACFRRFASEPFAGLLRFIASAPPTRQHTTAMLTLTYR